jgi:propanol-preferring alcohol dehydrogenase
MGSSLPTTQRAAQYLPKENKIVVNNITLPTPKEDELLIKVSCSSLCHSDLMLLEPNEAGLVLGDGTPITIGHEATGTILSVPKNCTDPTLVVGARVGFLCPYGVCYECEGCQIHNLHCEKGGLMGGFGVDGFFQVSVIRGKILTFCKRVMLSKVSRNTL